MINPESKIALGSPTSPPPGPVLVVGCGYLGRRAVGHWLHQTRTVYAITRNRAAELQALGISPIVADVTDSNSLALLGKLSNVTTLLYAVGLDRRAGKTMRDVYVNGLTNVLTQLPTISRIIYISSTSVYEQVDGEWVDGDSTTHPMSENGKVVREAEMVLQSHAPHAVILRFAGIYGPDRLLRAQQLRAGEIYTGNPDLWLNLIHVEDGVRAIHAAEQRAAPGSVITISDGQPVTRREFYTRLAEKLGAPVPQFAPCGQDKIEPNRRVRAWDGFPLQYPNYESGLNHILASATPD